MAQVLGQTDFEDHLNNLYYTPSLPSSLGGKKKLIKDVIGDGNEINRRVDEWTRSQDAYTLHKPIRTKFKRRKTIVAGIGEQVQMDLMDVKSHREWNDGTTFLLTAVDVFSKRGWAFPLKSKTGKHVGTALEQLLEETSFRQAQTDKGKEFYNRDVQKVLEENGVKHFSSEDNTIKASMVERFNRTLRGKIHRHITYTRSGRFIDVLDRMVESYNSTVHGATGVAPKNVDKTNQAEIWNKLYESDQRIPLRKPKLKDGDHVRMAKTRGAFERGFTPNWTEEIFVVSEVLTSEYPIVYRVKDLADEDVAGTFYETELQRVKLPTEFEIEDILKRRGKGKNEQIFVKWRGYPVSFNSWVSKKDFV